MFSSKHTVARLARTLAVAASLLALAAPSAFGRVTDPPIQGGTAPAQGQDPWYAYALSLTRANSAPFITDTLAPGGGNAAPVQGYRFITDTLAPGGGPSEVSAPSATGFDWGDAGIGAATMAAIGLLLLGSARLLHRRNLVAV